MENEHGCDDKWKEEVECKEPGECGIINGEAPSNPLYQGITHIWNGGEEVGDDSSASE